MLIFLKIASAPKEWSWPVGESGEETDDISDYSEVLFSPFPRIRQLFFPDLPHCLGYLSLSKYYQNSEDLTLVLFSLPLLYFWHALSEENITNLNTAMDILVSWRKFSFKVLRDYYMKYIASGTCINPYRATQQSFKGQPLTLLCTSFAKNVPPS